MYISKNTTLREGNFQTRMSMPLRIRILDSESNKLHAGEEYELLKGTLLNQDGSVKSVVVRLARKGSCTYCYQSSPVVSIERLLFGDGHCFRMDTLSTTTFFQVLPEGSAW